MDSSIANDSDSPIAQDPRYPSPEGPALPYAKAFVVQFTAGTDAQLERATGRLEHLQTGRRERFTSIADLLARLTAMLADVQDEPTKRGGSPTRGRRAGGSKGARGMAAGPSSP